MKTQFRFVAEVAAGTAPVSLDSALISTACGWRPAVRNEAIVFPRKRAAFRGRGRDAHCRAPPAQIYPPRAERAAALASADPEHVTDL
jgi:hypothetical protein